MENNETTELQERPAVSQRALEVQDILGDSIEKLRGLIQKVDTEETRDAITAAAVNLKTKVKELEGAKERYYEPERLRVVQLRDLYNKPLELAKAVLDSASSAVSEYNARKRREAELAREKAEAEARKAREEAEAKKRAAEEAERRAKAEAEARKRAEEEERLRQERAKLAAERAKFEAEQAERARQEAELARKRKEEEEARIAHALEAERVGNAHKTEAILDRQKALPAAAPEIPTAPSQAEIEAKAREQAAELERKAAAERAAAEARAREAEEKAKAETARREAEEAAAKAKEAEMAASATANLAGRPDDRTRASTNWKYRVADPKAFVKAIAGIVDRDPSVLEWLGFKLEDPGAFRSAALNKDVTRLKASFQFPGIEAWPEAKENFRTNDVKKEEEAHL